jgi:hypothetical protein
MLNFGWLEIDKYLIRFETVLEHSRNRVIPDDACVDRYARWVGGRRHTKKDSHTGRRKRRLVVRRETGKE